MPPEATPVRLVFRSMIAFMIFAIPSLSGCDGGPGSKAGSINMPAPTIPKPPDPKSRAGSVRMPKPAEVHPPSPPSASS